MRYKRETNKAIECNFMRKMGCAVCTGKNKKQKRKDTQKKENCIVQHSLLKISACCS